MTVEHPEQAFLVRQKLLDLWQELPPKQQVDILLRSLKKSVDETWEEWNLGQGNLRDDRGGLYPFIALGDSDLQSIVATDSEIGCLETKDTDRIAETIGNPFMADAMWGGLDYAIRRVLEKERRE